MMTVTSLPAFQALAGDHDPAAVAHASLHPHGSGRRCRCRKAPAGGSDSTQGRQLVAAHGAGPRADERLVGDGVHEVSIESQGDSASRKAVADLVVLAFEADQAVAVDEAVDLDGLACRDGQPSGLSVTPRQRRDGWRRPGRSGSAYGQPAQVFFGQP